VELTLQISSKTNHELIQIRKFKNCGAYWLLFELVWAKNLQSGFSIFRWKSSSCCSKLFKNFI